MTPLSHPLRDAMNTSRRVGTKARISSTAWAWRLLHVGLTVGFSLWLNPQRGLAADAEVNHVGVWYFTLWNSSAHSMQVTQSKRIYGRADPWGGVRDYAEGNGVVPVVDPTTQRPVDYANRRPLLGFYDLKDSNIVRKEIKEAASEGIEFLALYWYFNAKTGDEEDVSAPTSIFFSSPERSKIKLLLAPIALSNTGDKNVTLSAWREKTVPLLVKYMASDAYYRVDERPVVIDFSVNFIQSSDEIAAYAALREAAKSALGVDPMIVHMLPGGAKYGDMGYFQKMIHPDGFACFANLLTGSAEPYAKYIAQWIPKMTAQITPPGHTTIGTPTFIPCGSIGTDPRPWYEIGRDAPNGPNSMEYTTGTTPALFRQHLIALKNFIAQNRRLTRGIVILYAWNEWGEAAAAIEPSMKEGYAYADVVREVFGLRPRGPRP
jgi:Glycosyltransferase WbsX